MITTRKQYAKNLSKVNSLSPNGKFFRTMSYAEVRSWLYSYEQDVLVGWPHEHAVQRAWDCYFAAKKADKHLKLTVY